MLHAGWEFLFPLLGSDPRPLKLQFLLDVFLLTLLVEGSVIVAGGRQKVQYLFYRMNAAWYESHSDGDYMVLRLGRYQLRVSVRVGERG